MSRSKHKAAYWSSGRNENHDEAIKHPETDNKQMTSMMSNPEGH